MPSAQTVKPASPKDTPLSLSQVVAYALPTLAVAFLYSPINMAIINGVYAKYFGLSLTAIASALLIARLFDAFSDPLVGYLSDRYYQRKGNRQLFVLAGGVLLVCCSYFLYIPVGLESTEHYAAVSSLYFMVWLLLFHLAWTLFEIPHMAWGCELSSNSKEQCTIFSMRTGGYYLGGLLFYVVPLLPIFPSHSITPHTLAVSVVVAAVFTLPAFFYCIKMTPKRVFIARNTHIEQTDAQEKRLQSLVILKSIITNKPLLLFLLAFVFGGVGIGMYVGLSYIFADSFLGMGERLPLIYLFSMASGILSVAVWHKLACRVNKTLIWGAGVLILMAGVLGTTRLVPGESSWLSLLFLEVLFATGSTAIAVFTAAILADIVDYATLKSGQDYAGSYYAVYTLALKSNIAIGAAIGLMVAGFSGFDASAVSHDDAHILGLHLAIAYIPAVSIAISLIFIALTPIGERRQTIIRRRLNNNTLRKSIDG